MWLRSSRSINIEDKEEHTWFLTTCAGLVILGGKPQSAHTHQMENPLAMIVRQSGLIKLNFEVYECLSPCTECRGSYSGLGMKVHCRCDCHCKQKLVRSDDRQWSSANRIYETGISGRKFVGIDASNLEDSRP